LWSWKKWQRNFVASLRLKKRTAISTKTSPVTNVYGFWWSSSTMGLSKDWREFLELLDSRGVDYVIVGADRADPSIVRSVILNEVKDLTQVD
jgi:hypothetical protein